MDGGELKLDRFHRGYSMLESTIWMILNANQNSILPILKQWFATAPTKVQTHAKGTPALRSFARREQRTLQWACPAGGKIVDKAESTQGSTTHG